MLEQLLEEKGFQTVCGGRYLPCSMAVPRVQEIYACLNRCRELAVAGLK